MTSPVDLPARLTALAVRARKYIATMYLTAESLDLWTDFTDAAEEVWVV